MILISEPQQLLKHFLSLLDQYPKYYFATAWAGLPSQVTEKLLKNSSRIMKFAVGIHFYQTDPKFFCKFMAINNLRAVLQASGTFHPKVYLFMKDRKNWTLLMGSANFTKAAFSVNTEATVLIDSSEANMDFLDEAMKVITNSWNQGNIVNQTFLDLYTLFWNRARGSHNDLEDEFRLKKLMKDGIGSLMQLRWIDFVAKFPDDIENFRKRFEMLEAARVIFQSGRTLMEMSMEERRFLCGNKNKAGVPGTDFYDQFGTNGKGEFMTLMINGNHFISKALDQIPLTGIVTEGHFNAFLASFLLAPKVRTTWVSSAARLLALKRPDVFFNITGANRRKFCLYFNNTMEHTKDLKNYWLLIVEKIHLSSWYNEDRCTNDFERQLFNARAAILDVLCYE